MNAPPSPTNDTIGATLVLVVREAAFYRDLILEVARADSSPAVFLGLAPYLAMFVIESSSYIVRLVPAAKSLLVLQHNDLLVLSRSRAKLLDTTRMNIPESLIHVDWIRRLHYDWFMSPHRGLLGPLKRYLQCDLGLYRYRGHLVATTHSWFFNLGYDAPQLKLAQFDLDTAGPLLLSLGRDLGAYVSTLLRLFRFLPSAATSIPSSALAPIEDADIKSERFYRTIAGRLQHSSESVAAYLTLPLTHLNFLCRLLPPLFHNAPDLLFKLKFVSGFHVLSSVASLQDYLHQDMGSQSALRTLFRDILSSTEARWLRKRESLRNAIVHYGLPESVPAPSEGDSVIPSAVEQMSRRPFADVSALLDGLLDRTATLLEDYLGVKNGRQQ